MATAIRNLPTGGSILGTKNITLNGNYTASADGLDGYSKVNINVPNSYNQSDEGKVVSGGELVSQTAHAEVTQNGTIDTTLNNSVVVDVQSNLQSKTVTENGTVTPDAGYDGLSSVVVNVSGGGGDDPFALTDYIESSGTQYIDTGYIVKDNSLFEAVAFIANPNIQWGTLFGTRVGQDNNVCLYGVYGNNRPGIVVCWGGSQTELMTLGITAITGTKAVYSMFKQNFSLQNQEYVLGGEPAGMNILFNSYPIYLFADDTAGTADSLVIAKLYRFRIYESSTLVHEFIPWQENGVACLKDTVTSEIKYNAGTGDFVYGTDS